MISERTTWGQRLRCGRRVSGPGFGKILQTMNVATPLGLVAGIAVWALARTVAALPHPGVVFRRLRRHLRELYVAGRLINISGFLWALEKTVWAEANTVGFESEAIPGSAGVQNRELRHGNSPRVKICCIKSSDKRRWRLRGLPLGVAS